MRKISAVALSWRSGRSPLLSDADDAREAEIGPQQAGAHHAVVRNDDQALELLVARIGEREHRPIGIALARAHVHALHDAVGPRGGRYQQAVGVGAMALDRGRQIECGGILRHVDRLDRAGGRGAGQNDRADRGDRDDRDDRQPSGGADETQTTISKCESPIGKSPAELARAADRRRDERSLTAIQHYVDFAARHSVARHLAARGQAACGFAAARRHRAETAQARTKPTNLMSACTVHRVSTILPI